MKIEKERRIESYHTYLNSKDWKSLRKKVIERDKSRCVFCNKKFKEVHHIRYPKRFKEDHIDNIICICKSCHRRLHGIKDDDLGLLNAIKDRLKDLNKPKYLGILDMSATHNNSMEDCRNFNFRLIKERFENYLPNLKLEDFKLWCWKGMIWWGEKEDYKDELAGLSSEKIIFKIIKNKWETKFN